MTKKTIGMKTRSEGVRASIPKPTCSLAPVIPLKQLAAPLDARSSAYVKELRDLLSLAMDGKLTGLVWAGAEIGDEGQRWLIHSTDCYESQDPVSMIGLVEVMKRELLQAAYQ